MWILSYQQKRIMRREMMIWRCELFSLLCVLVFTRSYCRASSSSTHEDFLKCLAFNSESKAPIYTPNTYSSILQSSIQNLRFSTPTTPKPQFIITPTHESQVQASVICTKKHGFQIRVLSGGHDFEGLSYTSNAPFVIINLVNLQSIDVNIEDNSAWVQAGATVGEVYYRIAEKSSIHGFPAGICPTVGVGGHISGAGFGTMMRKYGMAADYVLDARLVNANGEILDRESMGEDLFWAIRGGGAASFGALLAWKIKLVPVPPIVTVSTVYRTLEQGASELVHKWQTIANEVPQELFIALQVTVVSNTASKTDHTHKRTVQANFLVMFLGPAEKLVNLMEHNFPELGMKQKDCMEMSWIESVVSFAGFPNATQVDVLLNRTSQPKTTFKAKSDFVTDPVPRAGLEETWKRFLEEERAEMIIAPWGGVMNEISEHEIAFPHRGGNLYLINYVIRWDEEEGKEAAEKHISWIRELYSYMGPYVSKSPRIAYLNYKDLDLGQNKNGTATYYEARQWGEKYFKSNFQRLVQVKSKVDPDNFFRNEQSIPVITSQERKKGD